MTIQKTVNGAVLNYPAQSINNSK